MRRFTMTTEAEERDGERGRRVSLHPLTFKEAVAALLQTKPDRDHQKEEGSQGRKEDQELTGGGESNPK